VFGSTTCLVVVSIHYCGLVIAVQL
jgi:hypothetical protein